MSDAARPRRIVVDTDPGLDDAVALWLALGSAELETVAVLAGAGNVGLDRTLVNACSIVTMSGRDVPVHAGADRPLVGDRLDAVRVHGADGLGAVRLPPGRAPAPGLAADVLRRLLRSGEVTTLVGIGPVTNLALALATEPAIARHVDEIVLMAGADGRGNQTPHAEFNASADPEALAIVLGAGPMVTFATLDLTAQALMTGQRLLGMEQLSSGACLRAAVALLRAIPAQARYADGGRPVHDACAVAWLIAPGLFTARDCHARVLLDGEERGRTVFSAPGRGRPANARLLERIDADGFARLLGERLAALP
jgi:purine nucleosidase